MKREYCSECAEQGGYSWYPCHFHPEAKPLSYGQARRVAEQAKGDNTQQPRRQILKMPHAT